VIVSRSVFSFTKPADSMSKTLAGIFLAFLFTQSLKERVSSFNSLPTKRPLSSYIHQLLDGDDSP
jgi:hypothetical protein